MTRMRGKVSWFGGPDDTGVSPDEGLAFIYDYDTAPHLFLDEQPYGTTGLARRLNPDKFYIACRWNYDLTSKEDLLSLKALVRNPKTGAYAVAEPSDWGPHIDTDRLADISPGLMSALDLTTDDEVEVIFPLREGEIDMPYSSICISSGHGLRVRGASGILDEVDEARRVVNRVAELLVDRGVEVDVFHDDTSTSQDQNLSTIVNHHNNTERELDISVHFNAYEQVSKPMGTECLYVTQASLSGQISEAIADATSLPDRGAKKRSDLYFLNNTDMPAILIETVFVDSTADAAAYEQNFEEVCEAIATVLGGAGDEIEIPPPGEIIDRPPILPPTGPIPRVDIEVSGEVLIFVNGEQVGTKG